MRNNIKEERMMVLNLIQEGKVTVEEATKLLETLNIGQSDEPYYQNFEFEEKINRFSNQVDAFAKDVGDRMSTTFKDVEPKLKKATKTVVEKAVTILDDISGSLNETAKNLEENIDCQCDETAGSCAEEEPQDDTPREN